MRQEAGGARLTANKDAVDHVSSIDDHVHPEFVGFYRTRAARTLRYARTLLGERDAEDAWQEAWLRIWRAWGTSAPDRIEAWAFRIVRNCCIDGRRSRRSHVPFEEPHIPIVPSPDEICIARADAAAALPILDRLAPPFREALWLREVMGWSYAEIAEAQGIPIGTVMSRLHKARRRAARLLRAEGF